ncbi:T9SS type A sorting domain-containing protein [Ohtaekwangia koreensis]|nr:T9SS type A sorting domain-containing protein [Ohtaekwangia koreensis]
MKKILVVLIGLLGLFAAEVQGQAITKYRVRVWFGRNNSELWCYTLTMIGMKVKVGNTTYNVPDGVNSNNFFEVGQVVGPLPDLVSLNFFGQYRCSGSSSGTRTYTVNLALTNTEGCGGTYSYSSGVNTGHGISFNVYLEPLEIAPLSMGAAPSCLTDNVQVNVGAMEQYGSYYVEAGIFDPGTGTVSNIKSIYYHYGSNSGPYPGGTGTFNIKTGLGADYATYTGKYIVYRGKLDYMSTPCTHTYYSVYPGLTTAWTAPYYLNPLSPVMNDAVTSSPPHCTAKPATGTLTIPTITGSAATYVYSVTKLVPRNAGAGVDCPVETRITHNGVEYCPGTATYNKTGPGTDAVTFDNLTTGIYQIKVENQGITNPCTQAVVHEIGAPGAFTASASPNTPNGSGNHIICYGGNSGQISFSVSGGTGPYTYNINNVDRAPDVNAPPTFTNLTANTYVLKVKDSNGCDTDAPIADIELKQTPATEALSADFVTLKDPTCYNGANGSVSLQVNYGAAPFSYTLNSAAVSASGADRSPVIGTLSANLAYTIRITDANSCQTQLDPFTLTQPADIVFTGVDKVDLVCNGIPTGSLKVIGGAGGTAPLEYSNNNGASYQADPEFKNLSAASYSVIIRDKNQCVKTVSTETINQPSAIVFSTIGNSPQSCPEILDGMISLLPSTGGTGTHTYSIDDTNYIPETATIQFTGLASGSYTLYTKDAQGCKVTAPYFLPSRPAITGTFAISNPISCNGDTDGALNLTPGGGTGPYTFKWSTNATTEDIAGLTDNLYTVEIKDSKGCLKSFDYDLQQPAVLTLQPTVLNHSGYGVSCKGSTDGAIDLTVLGGTGPFTYAWSTTSIQEDIANLVAGNYDVHVTDAHGCKASSLNISVTEPTVVALSLGIFKNISCYSGSNGELQGVAQGGVGYYEYSLDGSTWQDEDLFDGLKAQGYTIHMRDGNGCVSNTVNHTLTEPPLLVLALSKKVDTSCGAANGSAEVGASGGAGNYQYSWFDVTNAEIGEESAIPSLASGDYKAVVQDGNGCVTNIAVIINDSDGPKIAQQLLKGLTCFESNDGEIAISVSEGLPPYSIQWDTQATTTGITNVTGGEHWVEVLDSKGCRGKQVFNVAFPSAIAVEYINTMPLCTGNADGGISIVASGGNAGGYNYIWSTGSTATSLIGIKAGTYQITVTDSKNCKLIQDIVLPDPPLFVVDAGGDRTICVGQKLSVRAQEDNATYLWTSDAGYTNSDREVILTIPAKYTLKVITQNGCEALDSFVLSTSNDLLQADFLMAAEAYAGDTVILIDVSWPIPEAIDWSIPAEAKIINSDDVYAEIIFENPGEYEVILNTHLGECMDNYTKSITIMEGQPATGGRQGAKLVQRFDIFPNPNNGEFTVQVEFSESVNGRLRLISTSGKNVFRETITDTSAYTIQTALQSIPSGIYFLVLEAGHETLYKRIVVK